MVDARTMMERGCERVLLHCRNEAAFEEQFRQQLVGWAASKMQCTKRGVRLERCEALGDPLSDPWLVSIEIDGDAGAYTDADAEKAKAKAKACEPRILRITRALPR